MRKMRDGRELSRDIYMRRNFQAIDSLQRGESSGTTQGLARKCFRYQRGDQGQERRGRQAADGQIRWNMRRKAEEGREQRGRNREAEAKEVQSA